MMPSKIMDLKNETLPVLFSGFGLVTICGIAGSWTTSLDYAAGLVHMPGRQLVGI